MENKMKKLIALFAVSAVATTSAVAGVAISGTASVSYDDNGSKASATSYDADLSFVGTAGATSITIGMDVDGSGGTATGQTSGGTAMTSGSMGLTGVDLSTKIGPVTVAADMFNEASIGTSSGGNEREGTKSEDTGVTISLDAPIGDATLAIDNDGDVTVSGTWSGVSLSHTSKSAGDTTTASAAIAGMDISVTNKAGDTTWSLGTTVSGVALTLASSQKVTATFGLAGNTMVVTSVPERKSAAVVAGVVGGIRGTRAVTAKASYATVAISRDLTSGATLSATYNTFDDSLTLKAAVAF
jgi:hypothetical protein